MDDNEIEKHPQSTQTWSNLNQHCQFIIIAHALIRCMIDQNFTKSSFSLEDQKGRFSSLWVADSIFLDEFHSSLKSRWKSPLFIILPVAGLSLVRCGLFSPVLQIRSVRNRTVWLLWFPPYLLVSLSPVTCDWLRIPARLVSISVLGKFYWIFMTTIFSSL